MKVLSLVLRKYLKMTIEARISAKDSSIQRPARSVVWPTTGNRNAYPSEIYGQNVCDLKTLAASLPKSVYAGFVAQLAVFYFIYAIGKDSS